MKKKGEMESFNMVRMKEFLMTTIYPNLMIQSSGNRT